LGDATGHGPVEFDPAQRLDPVPPEPLRGSAEQIFGDRLDLAIGYADRLMTDGVVRGLIGPREAPRIWDRHLLNCAVVAELIPRDSRVIDVGSGAGLPGVALAVARPDLSIILVEPSARRTAFLSEVVASLNLVGTTVVRARAEELPGRAEPGPADVVTARAVAPLDRLAAWCLPLATVGGHLLAFKGGSAAEEIAVHTDAIRRLGGSAPVITVCGAALLPEPTTVVDIVRERDPAGSSRSARRPRRDRRTR
jgi:16S rRNA (guanine527-N7)-methyltransferase